MTDPTPRAPQPTDAQWNALPAFIQKKRGALLRKRAFDLFFSTLGLIVLCLPFLICAILIRLGSSGPVFYRQVRVGRGERPFRIFKFRTMVADADKQGMALTVGGDARITRVGKTLRKYKIDELPQLINVLLGDMSLVGPRPEVPKYVALYTPAQKNVLLIRPGITDMASIAYRRENALLAESPNPEDTYVNVVMQDKLALNYQYFGRIGVLEDIRLVLKTVGKVLAD